MVRKSPLDWARVPDVHQERLAWISSFIVTQVERSMTKWVLSKDIASARPLCQIAYVHDGEGADKFDMVAVHAFAIGAPAANTIGGSFTALRFRYLSWMETFLQ